MHTSAHCKEAASLHVIQVSGRTLFVALLFVDTFMMLKKRWKHLFLQEQDVTVAESIEADILSSHNLGNPLSHLHLQNGPSISFCGYFSDVDNVYRKYIENIAECHSGRRAV